MRSRGFWTAAWVAFGAVWWVGATFSGVITSLACDGDGGEPYAAPASPMGHFCARWDKAADHGPTLVLGLLALFLVGGLAAIYWRRLRLLAVMGVVAALVAAAPFAIGAALPNTCSPDDESQPGCSHY